VLGCWGLKRRPLGVSQVGGLRTVPVLGGQRRAISDRRMCGSSCGIGSAEHDEVD
jgi:hypothetical protein